MSTKRSKKKKAAAKPAESDNWNGDPVFGRPKRPAVKEDGTYDPFLSLGQSRPEDDW